MNWNEAQQASNVAWNMIYLANLPEYSSSKYVHKNPNKRKLNVGIPTLFTIRAWEMIRPQDRFESKLKNNEAWGPVGVWAVNQKNKPRLFGEFKAPNILPSKTMETPFHNSEDENGNKLIDIYHWYGSQLIDNPSVRYRSPKLSTEKEGIYAAYQFDYIDYAQDLNLFITGKAPIDLRKLGNIYEKLGFEKGRTTLTMILGGIDTNKKNITPSEGWHRYEIVHKDFKSWYPALFDR